MLIKTSGILIKKDHIDYDQIKQSLTRIVDDYNDVSRTVKFFEEFPDGTIKIPRYYPIVDEIEDKSCEGSDIEIDHKPNVQLRQSQIPAVDFLLKNNSAIIKMPTGIGKTFTSIYTIAEIKKKTIIFAHKNKLLEQWKDEFLNFTDLKKDDIGFLSTNNYEKILKKKIILCTPHVIMYAKKHNSVLFLNALATANIGIAFFDEVHCAIGAEELSKASLEISCKRTYGLSATPFRSDNNTDIIHYHLGNLIEFPAEPGEIMDPIIYTSHFDFGVNKAHRKYINWGGSFNIQKYNKMLLKSDIYCKTMVKVITKLYNSNRTILVLATTEKQLLTIAEMCAFPKNDVGIFIGKTDKKTKEKYSDVTDLMEAFKTKRVVMATVSMARDGNNNTTLDSLVLLNNTSNIIQAVGRIIRTKEGKKQPIVFDFIDTDPTVPKVWNLEHDKKIQKFEKAFSIRKKIYDSLNWEIKEVKI